MIFFVSLSGCSRPWLWREDFAYASVLALCMSTENQLMSSFVSVILDVDADILPADRCLKWARSPVILYLPLILSFFDFLSSWSELLFLILPAAGANCIPWMVLGPCFCWLLYRHVVFQLTYCRHCFDERVARSHDVFWWACGQVTWCPLLTSRFVYCSSLTWYFFIDSVKNPKSWVGKCSIITV